MNKIGVISMFYYEGLSCPVCNRAFSSNDDIVVCPQCGLPHHRDCWVSIGNCHAADKHGTDQQWNRQHATDATDHDPTSRNTQVCPRCQTENAEFAEFCNKCGSPLSAQEWASSPNSNQYHYGEYSPYAHATPSYDVYTESEIICDVSAKDLAAVVGKNQKYYMKRFRNIHQGASGGWNWAAFLLSPYWLFYRKQYLLGILYLIVFLLSNISFAILYAPVQLATTPEAAEAAMLTMMEHPLIGAVSILSFLFLALKIIIGIRGNAFYLRFCRDKIENAKTSTPDISSAELTSLGGISTGLAVLIYVIVSLLIEIVTILVI